MPTIEWLKEEFHYGYDSGDVMAFTPDEGRKKEETIIGGSYRRAFCEGCLPFISTDSKVLELGPGRGSWSRAILQYVPQGELHTLDFQDVTQWLRPERHGGRLVCHKVHDNSFSAVPDNYFDFFWSFGVLCHQNCADLFTILKNSLSKVKPGKRAVHEHADWEKLNRHGWERGGVPISFQSLPDNEIWWPRNTRQMMCRLAAAAGWKIICEDLDLFGRDGLIVLERPEVTEAGTNNNTLSIESAVSLIDADAVVDAIAMLGVLSHSHGNDPGFNYVYAVALAKGGLLKESKSALEVQMRKDPQHAPSQQLMTFLLQAGV